MTEEDLKKLVAIMNDLAEEYDQDYSISELKIEKWDELLLKPYGIEKIKKAALCLFKTRKYSGFPKISEMIEAIEGSDKDFEAIALEQFLKAKNTIINIGSYSSVSFDDPVINKTLDAMGGWIQFCMTQEDNWTWKQKDFIKIYLLYKRQFNRNELDEIPEYLPGQHATSQSNIRQSYKPQIEYVVTNPAKIPEAPKLKYDGRNAKKFLSDLNESIKEKNEVTNDES